MGLAPVVPGEELDDIRVDFLLSDRLQTPDKESITRRDPSVHIAAIIKVFELSKRNSHDVGASLAGHLQAILESLISGAGNFNAITHRPHLPVEVAINGGKILDHLIGSLNSPFLSLHGVLGQGRGEIDGIARSLRFRLRSEKNMSPYWSTLSPP